MQLRKRDCVNNYSSFERTSQRAKTVQIAVGADKLAGKHLGLSIASSAASKNKKKIFNSTKIHTMASSKTLLFAVLIVMVIQFTNLNYYFI